MTPQVDTAQILSFQLKVPPEELQQLVEQHLHLTLEEEANERVLAQTEGDCYLRFRIVGTEAMLTEVFLLNDESGRFFQRVLGQLMIRFQGNLHARLFWNTAEAQKDGEFAEVRIERGRPSADAFSKKVWSGLNQVAATEEAKPTAFENEISSLLEKAQNDWEKYQQQKRKHQP